MYDLSGLEYRLFSVGLISLFCGLVCFIISIHSNNIKRIQNKSTKKSHFNKEATILGVLFVCISLIYSGYYIFKIHQPIVCIHEGYFVEEYRNSRVAPPLPFTVQYTFTNNNQSNRKFYLDVFSKSKIYDKEFEKNSKYLIYYEEDTNIIVKVDKVE